MSDPERTDVPPSADAHSADTSTSAASQRSGAETQAEKRAQTDGPAATLSSASKPPRVPPARVALNTLSELLLAVYGKQRKRPKLSAKDIAAMQAAAHLQPDELLRLRELASADRTLERTRMLMAIGVERLLNTSLAGPVRDFVREVLLAHPVFRTPGLLAVLQNDPGSPDEEAAARILTSRDVTTLQWPNAAPPLKQKEVAQCRANALGCLLLWIHQSRGVSPERILRCLQKNSWTAVGPRRQQSDRQKVTALVAARDLKSLAVVCDLLDEELRGERHQAATARSSEERAAARALRAENALADCQVRADRAETDVRTTNELLQKEQREREAESAHGRDDYEKLRGRVLQRIKEEVSLLEEGLQALRREPPKVHVMIDHAERAIEALKREIDRLRGEE